MSLVPYQENYYLFPHARSIIYLYLYDKCIRDTALLLLLLLVFAIASSGYVLKKGIEDGKKSKYQLLLHCVLIVTSVIPPELPMQMALAVNSALITLMRMQIFCTEPFRVPLAGKVDVCLFDKTGTLTTDELVAVGVTDLKVRQPYMYTYDIDI